MHWARRHYSTCAFNGAPEDCKWKLRLDNGKWGEKVEGVPRVSHSGPGFKLSYSKGTCIKKPFRKLSFSFMVPYFSFRCSGICHLHVLLRTT